MTFLTEKEQTAIDFLANQGLDCMGGEGKADLKSDNMSWFNIKDLMTGMGLNRHEAAGIMSALDAKGLASDQEAGSTVRYDRDSWCLNDAGIDAARIPE